MTSLSKRCEPWYANMGLPSSNHCHTNRIKGLASGCPTKPSLGKKSTKEKQLVVYIS